MTKTGNHCPSGVPGVSGAAGFPANSDYWIKEINGDYWVNDLIKEINENGKSSNKYTQSKHIINGEEYIFYSGGSAKITTLNGVIESIDDNPAVEYGEFVKYWFKNNKLHREHHPAIITSGGVKMYFLNDIEFTEEEFINDDRNKKLKDILC
jgi:hypothetical protein